ncbi:MAG: hypothetical protein JNM62_05305 [Flavobacteriales bacterium]|nr:hypothetical protein [Flavobacteriales bacterium]
MNTPETEFVLVEDSERTLQVYNKRGHSVLIEDRQKKDALVSLLQDLSVPTYPSLEAFRKDYPSLRGYRQILVHGPKGQEVVRFFVDWQPFMPYASNNKPYAIAYLRDLISTYVGHKPFNTYLSEYQDTISAVVIIEANDFPQEGYDLRGLNPPTNKNGFTEV